MRALGLLMLSVWVGVSVTFAQDADVLSNFDTPPDIVMTEIEALGLFPSGSEFAFAEPGNTLIGGSQFITFDLDNTAPNFVFGGTLELLSEADRDQLETCAMVARATIESGSEENDDEIIEYAQINTFVDVGITNKGEVYVVDRFGTGKDDLSVNVFDNNIGEIATFAVIVLDNELTVYVNGERVVDELTVGATVGAFAFALESANPNTSCTGSDFWAYTLPEEYIQGRCEITTTSIINQRAGAGTDFDVVGQMSAEEIERAVAQAVGEDGFVWWQIDEFVWVREDVVSAVGDCRTLPQG